MAWQGIEASKQATEFSAEPSFFSSKKWIKLMPKTIGNRKKRLCVRLRSRDKHHLRKSWDRKAQIRKAFVPLTGLICAFRSEDFLRWGLSLVVFVVVLLGTQQAYLGLITGIPIYFCKSCLKVCREEADLIGDGREFQRRVLVKSGEIVPGRRAAPGMQSERVNWEQVVLCVLFEGDLSLYCWQSKELASACVHR